MFGILSEARVKVWMEVVSCLWTNASICVSKLCNGQYTLKAAIILNTLPNNLKEVFLTSATSNLSQAIANLPLSERCACYGELLPFTTQNSNSFLTNYRYFWRDALCVTSQVTLDLKILLCCPCFYPICTHWDSWAIVFLMLLSWTWCSFIFVLQMLIQSQDLYESMLTEVPIDYKQNLVQVTKYQWSKLSSNWKPYIVYIVLPYPLISALETINPQWWIFYSSALVDYCIGIRGFILEWCHFCSLLLSSNFYFQEWKHHGPSKYSCLFFRLCKLYCQLGIYLRMNFNSFCRYGF